MKTTKTTPKSALMRRPPAICKEKENKNNNPQLLVIRQHEAIAAANVPSVFETLPGWDQHQVLGMDF